MDHDALFKWLLKDPVILRSFFEEFLPEVASYTDFSRLEYLDKETRTLRGAEANRRPPGQSPFQGTGGWLPDSR
jgi:hypothetical protein